MPGTFGTGFPGGSPHTLDTRQDENLNLSVLSADPPLWQLVALRASLLPGLLVPFPSVPLLPASAPSALRRPLAPARLAQELSWAAHPTHSSSSSSRRFSDTVLAACSSNSRVSASSAACSFHQLSMLSPYPNIGTYWNR